MACKGVDKYARAAIGSEALDDLAQAVLEDFNGTLRAGLILEDPPASVLAMKVSLRPAVGPVQARARHGAPEKARFTSYQRWSLLGW